MWVESRAVLCLEVCYGVVRYGMVCYLRHRCSVPWCGMMCAMGRYTMACYGVA